MISRSESLPITIETSGWLIIGLLPSPAQPLKGAPDFEECMASLKRCPDTAPCVGDTMFGLRGLPQSASSSSAPSPQYLCDIGRPQSRSWHTLRRRAAPPFATPLPAPLLRARGRRNYRKRRHASISRHARLLLLPTFPPPPAP